METKSQTASAAQGAAEALEEAKTVETVRDYLKKDLSVAIACLNAIQSDPELLDTVAHWFHGRWQNAKHEPSK